MNMRLQYSWIVAAVLAVPSLAGAQSNGVRDVTAAAAKSIVQVNAKIRFSTMLVLPEGDDIMDVVCGDKEFWPVDATRNFALVKPSKEGATTNLHLITARGTVYSFLLKEGGTATPDLKVTVLSDGPAPGKVKYVPVSQVDALEAELASARVAMKTAGDQRDQAVQEFKNDYPTTLKFPYRTEFGKPPFLVRSIYHDDKFTYLKVDGREKPALYEVVDGKPALVNFQVKDGVYVVQKILSKGYLALGQARLEFAEDGVK
jgi:type IV secretory pathway VirB9-like protein